MPDFSQVPPTILPFTFGNDAVEAGQMGQLSCVVISGDSPLQITWSFHGHGSTTRAQKGVSTLKVGERSSLLVIDSITSEHSGTYSCFAKNTAGNASHSTELSVNGTLNCGHITLQLQCILLACNYLSVFNLSPDL